jgi:diguanylate cyclase (GGDEF)-like protein
VLVEMTRRITAIVRDIDTFARYGGEEFVLILPETNLVGGIAVAEKLRGAVSSAPFAARSAAGGVHLTVSVGIACYPEHATSRPSCCAPPTPPCTRPSAAAATG